MYLGYWLSRTEWGMTIQITQADIQKAETEFLRIERRVKAKLETSNKPISCAAGVYTFKSKPAPKQPRK
jgi:hypothetical protein